MHKSDTMIRIVVVALGWYSVFATMFAELYLIATRYYIKHLPAKLQPQSIQVYAMAGATGSSKLSMQMNICFF